MIGIRKNTLIYCVCFVLLSCVCGRAQSSDGFQYTVSNGLPDVNITSTTEASDGALWFCSVNGVGRFDGATWQHFTTDNGISDNWVRSSFEDSDGRIWLSTGNGVSVYDGNTWERFTKEDGIIGEVAAKYGITESADGSIWVATNGGISRYDGNGWQRFTEDDELISNEIRSLALTADKKSIWFASAGGVSHYDGFSWQHFSELEDVISIAVAADGTIWASTANIIHSYDGTSWNRASPAEVRYNGVNNIYAAENGDLWFASQTGVARYDGNTWQSFSTPERAVGIVEGWDGSIWCITLHNILRFDGEQFTSVTRSPNSNFSGITVLSDGGLLVSSFTDGAIKYDANTRKTYVIEDGLPSDFITALDQSTDGSIWVGTTNGVGRFDGQSWQRFTMIDGLANNRVNAVAASQNGSIWFGTVRGASRYDGTEWQTFTTSDGLAANNILAIRQASDGNMWFGTTGGVSRYDGANWTTYSTEDGLPANAVNAIVESSDGSMWFGTDGGASRYDGAAWETYTSEDGLAADKVEAMASADDGSVWFGTGEGLSHNDGMGWKTYTTVDGLSTNEVLCLLQAADSDLWVSTAPTSGGTIVFQSDGGASRFNGVTWQLFSSEDGLPDRKITALLEAADGSMWFGTAKGLYRWYLPKRPAAQANIERKPDSTYGLPNFYFGFKRGQHGSDEKPLVSYALIPNSAEPGPFDWTTFDDIDGFEASDLTNGIWSLHVRAVDRFGKIGAAPATFQFTVDTTPPTSVILGPRSGELLSGRVAVEGSAYDESPLEDFAEYTLEHARYIPGQNSAEIEWLPIAVSPEEVNNDTLGLWDASSLTGQYLLRLRSVDHLQHQSKYEIVVTVDNIPPSIELEPLTERSYTGTVVIRGEISDENPASYQVGYRRLQARDSTVYPIYADEIDNIVDGVLATWDSSNETGPIELVVLAFDQAGNSSEPAEIIVRFNNPTALPQVELTFPPENSIVSGVTEVRGRIIDPRISHYALLLYDTNEFPLELDNLNPVQAGEYVLTEIDTRNREEGSYNLVMMAYNRAGYANFSNITFVVDNTPPLAQISHPANGDTLRGWVDVGIEVSDEHLNFYQLDYGPGNNPPDEAMITIASGDSLFSGAIAWNTMQLQGQYTLVLTGMDAAGLQTSQRHTVWIDNAPISREMGGIREFGAIHISVPAGSLKENTALGVRYYDASWQLELGDADVRAVGVPFEIVASQRDVQLQAPITLSLSYDDVLDPEMLALFRMDSSQTWQRIGGTVGQDANVISTVIDSLGSFVLLEDRRSHTDSEATLSQLNCQPRMFSPRGGWSDRLQISFHLSNRAPVSISVYNMVGQRRKILLDATLNMGSHSLEWLGRDADGAFVEEGMYIVVAKVSDRISKQVVGVVNGGK